MGDDQNADMLKTSSFQKIQKHKMDNSKLEKNQ